MKRERERGGGGQSVQSSLGEEGEVASLLNGGGNRRWFSVSPEEKTKALANPYPPNDFPMIPSPDFIVAQEGGH